jgi:hypothetical protein
MTHEVRLEESPRCIIVTAALNGCHGRHKALHNFDGCLNFPSAIPHSAECGLLICRVDKAASH